VKATTGKAASSATLILFITELDTPTDNLVCPTIKQPSNSSLTKEINDIIDRNTGPLIESEKPLGKWQKIW
jgi:altronate hydrolase